MGNKTVQLQEKINYKQIETPHSMLNNTLTFHKHNKDLLKSQWPFYSKQQFDKWQRRYKAFIFNVFQVQLMEKSIQNIVNKLFIPLQYSYTKINICSPTGIVTMVYQKIQKSLIQIIEKNSKLNEPFSQNQIWNIMYSLVQTFSFFHKKNISIGDVRSQYIFVNFYKNQIKIATQVSWIGESNFLDKLSLNSQMFVSPQIIQAHSRNKNLTSEILIKNDDFALGLTLAQCILLEDLSKIYEIKDNCRIINKQKHQNLIQKLLKIRYYPLKLTLIVVGLIQSDLDARITSSQLYGLLKQHKKEISANMNVSITKQNYQSLLQKKYYLLQNLLDNFKSKTNREMFQNRQLFTSRAFTINGISTVHNVKRTYDETFNLSFLDSSRNQHPITHPKHLQFSAVDNNRSWSIDQKYHNFISKIKKSDVRDHKTTQYAPITIKTKKKLQHLKIQDQMAISEVKQIGNHMKQMAQPSFIPVTNNNDEGQMLQPKQNQKEQEETIKLEQNFSFHSPQSRLHKLAGQQQKQSQNKRQPMFEALSVSQSTQTLLIMPSVYSVSNPPQSYISYHYSKSIQNPVTDKQGVGPSQNQMSINLQNQLVINGLRKFSEQPHTDNKYLTPTSLRYGRLTVNPNNDIAIPSNIVVTRSQDTKI